MYIAINAAFEIYLLSRFLELHLSSHGLKPQSFLETVIFNQNLEDRSNKMEVITTNFDSFWNIVTNWNLKHKSTIFSGVSCQSLGNVIIL